MSQMVQKTGSRARRWSVAVVLAASVILGSTGTASAYHVVSDTGTHGRVVLADSEASPGAVCAYAFSGSSNGVDTWLFHSIRVKPPKVFAADRRPDHRDSRLVSWRYYLMELPYNSPGSYEVARSPVQKARAYDNAAAPFSAMRVTYDGVADSLYSVRVAIKWYKPDGSVEGRLALVGDWYGQKDIGTTEANYCDGAIYRS